MTLHGVIRLSGSAALHDTALPYWEMTGSWNNAAGESMLFS